MPDKNAYTRWQVGAVLVVVTLGILGAFLHRIEPCIPEGADDDHTRSNFHSIKWAFYVFLWFSCIYMYGFVCAAFRSSLNC